MLSGIKRVLVVKPDGLGDAVLASAFLRELRRNLPQARILLVVHKDVYPLVELCPYVNEILTYPWGPAAMPGEFRGAFRAFVWATRLWARRLDLAILARWDVDYYHGASMVYWSGARRRAGYSEKVNALKARLNRGRDAFFTHLCREVTVRHEVERNLDLIRFLGGDVHENGLELWLDDADKSFAEDILSRHGISKDEPLIAMGLGAARPHKQWSLGSYRQLVEWLTDEFGARILLVGSEAERAAGEEVGRLFGDSVIHAAGEATLRQTCALLERCGLYVGNDTFAAHAASAAGLKTFVISCHAKTGDPMSSRSPERFGPWGAGHGVIRPGSFIPPCAGECLRDGPHCILKISPENVQQVLAPVLEKRRAAHAA